MSTVAPELFVARTVTTMPGPVVDPMPDPVIVVSVTETSSTRRPAPSSAEPSTAVSTTTSPKYGSIAVVGAGGFSPVLVGGGADDELDGLADGVERRPGADTGSMPLPAFASPT